MGLETIADGAAGGILGLALSGINDKRQVRQQEKLQQLQIKGQKEMGIFNREQALQYWNETGAEAQRKQLEKAGLNVGLMYGSGGGGGGSTMNPAGSVSGAAAPTGGGEVGMGIQAGMAQAQMELMKAQTNKTNVEATKMAGADTEKTISETGVNVQTLENLKQGVKTDAAKESLTRMQSRTEDMKATVAEATGAEAITQISWDAQRAIAEARSAQAKGIVDQTTTNEAVSIIQSEAKNGILDSMLKDAQLGEIKQKVENLKAQIRQGDTKNAIEAFKAEVQAEYPAIWNTAGKVINDGLKVLETIGIHKDMGDKIKE